MFLETEELAQQETLGLLRAAGADARMIFLIRRDDISAHA